MRQYNLLINSPSTFLLLNVTTHKPRLLQGSPGYYVIMQSKEIHNADPILRKCVSR